VRCHSLDGYPLPPPLRKVLRVLRIVTCCKRDACTREGRVPPSPLPDGPSVSGETFFARLVSSDEKPQSRTVSGHVKSDIVE